MDEKEIVRILQAHISVKPHEELTALIADHIRMQPEGSRHFCTINGIEAAAKALAQRVA